MNGIQDCKCGKEMICVARDESIPSDHNPQKIGDPIVGTAWWCRECGRICVTGEVLSNPSMILEPRWMEPNILLYEQLVKKCIKE